ncbi:MAG: hypothetical protein UX99_C0007G0056 [Candidatus Amesbacteria bacterium GW2011_GWB1_47_26]|uniref:Uncharacterized protein n=1 Tax=Candidatus Amesbacteria bacterium GW2011_GWC2_45_19 TaxID=1618366 RepID=A0A0G1M3K0_9BACT|nr:MAG: hypothetical protein UX05_C0010G0034 [Candidatus Amesbacteria bacterium GW2011_GWC2_45_19]KKU38109.1 MAG: hypothetical protein UX52_C0011G0039 [Candidatus Amesbacteria bacterium GW2011_GWA1_46_35]KKU69081.1 MAG: hypothetical protein UX93_C0003G0073 [Microgenomates group bacterium GW2011_GWC1_47_20]KKU74768.1 MAG: hypothetical protein UX99_C0007G0056 [Candidatus Amesbacteria bacterium GW2011_GWB1_47_26]KKU80199.1 MAG: hypothetical protein UY06_C0004G0020 [Candidatus Amesbacteria bacteriu
MLKETLLLNLNKPKIVDLIHRFNGFNPTVDVSSPLNFEAKLATKQLEIVIPHRELTVERIELIKDLISADFESVASDLKTFDLAKGHANRLISYLTSQGAENEQDLLVGGAQEFYNVSRNVLGPLWTIYVNEALSSGQGGESYLFAARDATPMYWAARGLITSQNCPFKLVDSKLIHADWNRWFMGQEDETEDGQKPMNLSHPMLAQFYRQLGFGNGRPVIIIEPGAWGSAANALKTAMPDQKFELWFMFSHMPNRIYGYLNSHVPGIDPRHFEMINDTAEATPKPYVRPTELTYNGDGAVVADLTGKVLKSPFMRLWSWAVNQGAFDAGKDFSTNPQLDVPKHVAKIVELSSQSAQGKWTGVLPRNTLTWTEGEAWVAKWPWGKIPPKI